MNPHPGPSASPTTSKGKVSVQTMPNKLAIQIRRQLTAAPPPAAALPLRPFLRTQELRIGFRIERGSVAHNLCVGPHVECILQFHGLPSFCYHFPFSLSRSLFFSFAELAATRKPLRLLSMARFESPACASETAGRDNEHEFEWKQQYGRQTVAAAELNWKRGLMRFLPVSLFFYLSAHIQMQIHSRVCSLCIDCSAVVTKEQRVGVESFNRSGSQGRQLMRLENLATQKHNTRTVAFA